MALIVGVALAILSLAVVLYPFVTSRRNSRHPQGGDGRLEGQGSQGPQADLEEIYAAIETLRLEHQLGNIPQALYQEQLLGYRLEAAEALRRNSQAGSSDPDFLLEQEVLAARSALQDPDASGAGSTENRPNC